MNLNVKEEGEAKSIRQIRIRYSDLNAEWEYPFMRFYLTSLEEMYSRSLENLDDVVREAHEEWPMYCDILEISDRVKKSEPKNEFTKEKKDHSQSVSSFKKKAKLTRQWGRLLVVTRNLENSPSKMIWTTSNVVVSSAIKWDIMLISVPKLRRKTR